MELAFLEKNRDFIGRVGVGLREGEAFVEEGAAELLIGLVGAGEVRGVKI